MVLLENEQFLTELTRFYERAKQSGTVLTSMKRYDGRTKPHPRAGSKRAVAAEQDIADVDYKCLLRASYGSRKIRTVVQSRDMNKFQQQYSLLMRAYIELKKKEKSTSQRGANKNKGSSSSGSNAKSKSKQQTSAKTAKQSGVKASSSATKTTPSSTK